MPRKKQLQSEPEVGCGGLIKLMFVAVLVLAAHTHGKLTEARRYRNESANQPVLNMAALDARAAGLSETARLHLITLLEGAADRLRTE